MSESVEINSSEVENIVNDTNMEVDTGYQNMRFVIRTVQASAFRTLIEALKEILTDVNIEVDKTGIKIIAMDSSHVALIHMKLAATNFEKFYCPKMTICGVSMLRLYKLLKIMSPNDTLTFYVEKDEPSELKIQIDILQTQDTLYQTNIIHLNQGLEEYKMKCTNMQDYMKDKGYTQRPQITSSICLDNTSVFCSQQNPIVVVHSNI